jgi:hypothetical protein
MEDKMRTIIPLGLLVMALAVGGSAYAGNDVGGLSTPQADSVAIHGTVAGDYTATDVIGADIETPSGQIIEQASDLVIDPDNRVTLVLVDVGDLLGLGGKEVAIPIDDLQPIEGNDGESAFVTSLTNEELEALPVYVDQDETLSMRGDTGSIDDDIDTPASGADEPTEP